MSDVARVLAGLVTLLFLLFGVRYMFAPASVMETGGLTATSEVVFATSRAFIGAASWPLAF